MLETLILFFFFSLRPACEPAAVGVGQQPQEQVPRGFSLQRVECKNVWRRSAADAQEMAQGSEVKSAAECLGLERGKRWPA